MTLDDSAWTASQHAGECQAITRRLTVGVISKTTVKRETRWRLRRSMSAIGGELRRLRLDAGVSLRQLADLTGIDASHIARIEKGMTQASLTSLTTLSTALGADVNVRFFAGSGPRIHDRLQTPMLDGLIRSLAACWLPRVEVVVPGSRRGVADIVLTDRTRPQLVIGEAQSEFRRIEQQMRWIAEKAKAFEEADAGDRSVSRLLIVRSTAASRDIVRRYAATFAAAYPARTTDVVEALTRGTPWPGDGMVWMRLERGIAVLQPYPPRGVPVGR